MSTKAATAPRWRWRNLIIPLLAAGYVAFFVFLWRLPVPDQDAEVQACDRAVRELLTTHDLVDLQRAEYLIGKLNCGIARRLPRAEGTRDGYRIAGRQCNDTHGSENPGRSPAN